MILERAIDLHGLPNKITTDKNGANTAAIASFKTGTGSKIKLQQNKYLNNIVEQNYRAIKLITRPMLGFNSFCCTQILLTGIEVMHMIRKGQLDWAGEQPPVRCTAVLQLGVPIRSDRIDFLQLRKLLRQNPP